jgi:hypothetical protein
MSLIRPSGAATANIERNDPATACRSTSGTEISRAIAGQLTTALVGGTQIDFDRYQSTRRLSPGAGSLSVPLTAVAGTAASVCEGLQSIPVRLGALLVGRAFHPNSKAPDPKIAELRAALNQLDQNDVDDESLTQLRAARSGLQNFAPEVRDPVDFLSITDLLIVERTREIQNDTRPSTCLKEELAELQHGHAEIIETISMVSKRFRIEQESNIIDEARELLSIAANFHPSSGVDRDDARRAACHYVEQLPASARQEYARRAKLLRKQRHGGDGGPEFRMRPHLLKMRHEPGLEELADQLAVFTLAIIASYREVRWRDLTTLDPVDSQSLKMVLRSTIHLNDQFFAFTPGEPASVTVAARAVVVPELKEFADAYERLADR